MKKERVDILAVRQGLFGTREKAKRAIMAGLVVEQKNGERFDKPGEKISTELKLRVKGEIFPYVSRGAKKLLKAIKVFGVNFQGKTMLDIGSSTGGFTDVALHYGARRVYALDVGTNQLDWKLRNDSRVVVMEQTNFRYAKLADFKFGQPNLATIDVSFISLKLIFSPLAEILTPVADVVALIKPQFEAGREAVNKHGIVHDPKIHKQVLEQVVNFAQEVGFTVQGLDFSPITGRFGNIEFLIYLQKSEKSDLKSLISLKEMANVVKLAHENLK